MQKLWRGLQHSAILAQAIDPTLSTAEVHSKYLQLKIIFPVFARSDFSCTPYYWVVDSTNILTLHCVHCSDKNTHSRFFCISQENV